MLELVRNPDVDLAASGACHGLGLIETMRVENGRIPFLTFHAERLAAGAAFLGMEAPPGADLLRSALEPVSHNAEIVERGSLRLLAVDGRLIVAPPRALPATPAAAGAGIARSLALDSRNPIRRHKTMSRLEYELLAREAGERGLFEVVALNEGGRLADGSRTNFFAVIHGRVLTPPLSAGVLPGVARRLLLEADLAEEEELAPSDVADCDAVFLANALRLVIPLSEFEGRRLDAGHPAALAARDCLLDLVRGR